MIKSLNGTIHVESTVGKGSTFTVTLPFKLDLENNKESLTAAQEVDDKKMENLFHVQQKYLTLMSNQNDRNHSVEGKSSVIVAEGKWIVKCEMYENQIDNPINRKVIVNMLSSLGVVADFCSDGKELLEYFDVSHHQVVLTDMVSCNSAVNDNWDRICRT